MKKQILPAEATKAVRMVRNYCIASYTMICLWLATIFSPRLAWYPDYWTFVALAAFGFVSGFVLAIGCALHTMRNIEFLSPRNRLVGAAPLLFFGGLFLVRQFL